MAQERLTGPAEKTDQRLGPRDAGSDPPSSFAPNAHPILELQRRLGNRRVAELIRTKRLTPQGTILAVQPKLTVGAADDQYEKEAEQVARRVMSMPDSDLRRASAADADQREAEFGAHRSIRPYAETEGGTESFEAGPAVESKLSQSQGQGSPLPAPYAPYWLDSNENVHDRGGDGGSGATCSGAATTKISAVSR